MDLFGRVPRGETLGNCPPEQEELSSIIRGSCTTQCDTTRCKDCAGKLFRSLERKGMSSHISETNNVNSFVKIGNIDIIWINYCTKLFEKCCFGGISGCEDHFRNCTFLKEYRRNIGRFDQIHGSRNKR